MRILYPRDRRCRSQNWYISLGKPVSVFSQPGPKPLLMARPRSVHSALGKRRTSTSVSPFFTAWLMMAAARLSASSSEMPDGFDSSSSSAFFGVRLLFQAQVLPRFLGLGGGHHFHRLFLRLAADQRQSWSSSSPYMVTARPPDRNTQAARSCFIGRTLVRQAVGIVDSSFELLQIDLPFCA